MKKLIKISTILLAFGLAACKKVSPVQELPDNAAVKTQFKEVNACSSPPQIWGIRTVGGAQHDEGTQVVLHPSGIVALVGKFEGTVDFDPGPGVKYLSDGYYFSQWFDRNARFVNAQKQTYDNLAFPKDKQGNIYEIVMEDGIEDEEAVTNCSSPVTKSYALVKKGPAGIIWKKYIAMNMTAHCYMSYRIEVDNADNAIVNLSGSWHKFTPSGEPLPIKVPPTSMDKFWIDKQKNIYTGNKTHYPNMAVTKYKAESATPLWQIDIPFDGMGFDDIGNVYITGTFEGTRDFNPGEGTYNLTANTKTMYIMKVDAHGKFHWAKKLGVATPADVKWDTNGKYLYIAGSFTGTQTFATVTGNVTATSKGGSDAFIMALRLCK